MQYVSINMIYSGTKDHTPELRFIKSPSAEDYNVLIEGIRENAKKAKNMQPPQHSAFFLYDRGEIIGGIGLYIYLGCLSLERLWVGPNYRGQGFAKRLLQSAEDYGHQEGCHFAVLSTMDYEALDFYLKAGYVLEFERSGYDKDSTLYFLRKEFSR